MASRPRRANAGSKMCRLLAQQHDEDKEKDGPDEFYATTYGGFNDADEDGDYVQGKEEKDVVDSDFSIDEDDEPVSDHDQDDNKKRKKTNTRAYKEPTKPKPAPKTENKQPSAPKIIKKSPVSANKNVNYERKSIRKSTVDKSAETKRRIKIRNQLMKGKVKKSNVHNKMPSQEELLAEALETEIDNAKSLERFERLEYEKKITRPTKRSFNGPMIRYHSFTVNPLLVEDISSKVRKGSFREKKSSFDNDIEVSDTKTSDMEVDEVKPEIKDDIENKSDITIDDAKSETKTSDLNAEQGKDVIDSKYERTLLTFLNDINDKALRKAFPTYPQPKRKQRICAITKQDAKYFDPVTNLPYSSIEAFKILREAYYQQLESRGKRSEPEVAKWVEWRMATRKARQLQTVKKLTR